MAWAVVGAAAITVVGGAISANQAKKGAQGAANAQERANNATIEEQRRQYDLTRADNQGFMDAGNDALKRQEAFLNGDMSGFENNAGYKFQVQQGFQGLNRLASANGSYRSGGADADRMAYGQGLATQYADNYWNKLAGRAGQGQTAVNGLGTLGAGMANQISYANQRTGDARASSYLARADANSQFATGALGAVNNGWQQWNAQKRGG